MRLKGFLGTAYFLRFYKFYYGLIVYICLSGVVFGMNTPPYEANFNSSGGYTDLFRYFPDSQTVHAHIIGLYPETLKKINTLSLRLIDKCVATWYRLFKETKMRNNAVLTPLNTFRQRLAPLGEQLADGNTEAIPKIVAELDRLEREFPMDDKRFEILKAVVDYTRSSINIFNNGIKMTKQSVEEVLRIARAARRW
jgi:hypothetical protein